VLELLPAVLDSQLRRDAQLTLFEYFVLAMLSEASESTLRMTYLAAQGAQARVALAIPSAGPSREVRRRRCRTSCAASGGTPPLIGDEA
jgi:hypothetical protein